MMTLSTMRRVVDTLDDAGASPLADQVLSRWAHDPGSARYLRASANFLFTYSGGEPFVLRFNHADERRAEMIHAELDFVCHLAARDVQVAVPVSSLAGRAVESVLTTSGTYHAVSFQVIQGEQLDFSELTPRTLARWGSALGELHNASQGYRGSGRPTWRDHLGRVADELPADEWAARQRLSEVTNRLSQLPVAETTFGPIHLTLNSTSSGRGTALASWTSTTAPPTGLPQTSQSRCVSFSATGLAAWTWVTRTSGHS